MFDTPAEVQDRNGTVLASPGCDVWRETETAVDVGEQVAWAGSCSPDATAALVGKRNRILVVAGVEYRVEDAVHHPALNYVAVQLLQVRADG